MSVYFGRRGLERLRQSVSDRDLDVLHSVSQHRFLNARQIEALHFDNHSTPTAGARVCRRVLARLTRERVLQRLTRRVGGARAGSASYIYAVGPVGGRLLDQPRRVTEPSALFLEHTLAIGDVHVMLHRAACAGGPVVNELAVEPACWRRFIGVGGAADIVRPDLYVVTADGDYEDAWFLEVDRGTEGPAALARKCHAYERYWRSGREQAAHGAFPLTVWICPDQGRATQIERVITSSRDLNRDLFRVSTEANLLELLAGATS
jgi:hypothetical protein